MNFHRNPLLLIIFILIGLNASGQQNDGKRIIQLLDTGWKFFNAEVQGGEKPDLNTAAWQTVEVPHDWAISGPFDENNDLQVVHVVEDGEKVAKRRSGRTGGLPHIGIGWYRKTLDVPATWKGKKVFAEFDGAMSHAQVYLNGQFIGEWPYGYASFGFELTDEPGELKVVALDANNKPLKEEIIRTAGKPARIILKTDREKVSYGEKELAFVTVVVVDDKGVVCPGASNKITLSVAGAGKLRAADNGDATNIESFVDPVRSAFNGKCMAILQSTASKGEMKLVAQAPGLTKAEIAIQINK